MSEFAQFWVTVCVPEVTVTVAVFVPAVEYVGEIEALEPEIPSVPLHE